MRPVRPIVRLQAAASMTHGRIASRSQNRERTPSAHWQSEDSDRGHLVPLWQSQPNRGPATTVDSEPRLATVCKSQVILPRSQVASQPTLGVGHKRSLVVTIDARDCQSRTSDTAIVSTSSCQRQLQTSAQFHGSSLRSQHS
jgi:hypothetical protein